ncbi:MAG: DUF924 domain-containing protein [Betaproteobacteria bacterium]|nr:DUF924 domain-containing protein [Betaproteobacteria bacterium]
MSRDLDSEAREVLAFWFGDPGSPDHGRPRPEWFRKDDAFDGEIRRRFLALQASAALGEREGWRGDPDSLLALIVVLDQFSRNLYRDDPRAFSQDAMALDCAQLMISQGWDAARLPVERQFAYLPFEHAEDPAMQDRSIALFATLEAFPETKGLTPWAEKHRVIVRRFGRFPHRNAALGRESTAEEIAFLAGPDSRF